MLKHVDGKQVAAQFKYQHWQCPLEPSLIMGRGRGGSN